MLEEKINDFLEYLQKQGTEITGETAFICNDGAVMFIPTEEGKVDILLVRNPVRVDYSLGVTDADVELWKTTGELMETLGGNENG